MNDATDERGVVIRSVASVSVFVCLSGINGGMPVECLAVMAPTIFIWVL